MMDMAQLAALIAALGLGARSRVLELGCGNGRIAEYISDVTGAQVYGVDSSTVGIRQANERTAAKRDRLAFCAGDMAQVPLPAVAFDALVAIDSFYFGADLDGLFARLAAAVRSGGQMAVAWSSWAAASTGRASLAPDGNRFGQALQRCGLSFRTLDYTSQEAAHWRRKLGVLRRMEADFASEGNLFLYRKRLIEAESHQEYVEAGMVSRYLYLVRLPR
jgi:SAM-dependent methyltransferase